MRVFREFVRLFLLQLAACLSGWLAGWLVRFCCPNVYQVAAAMAFAIVFVVVVVAVFVVVVDAAAASAAPTPLATVAFTDTCRAALCSLVSSRR